MIKFQNGKHIVNYILKIFSNKDIILKNNEVQSIKNLEYIYDYINSHNIYIVDKIKYNFDNWITYAKQENISKFIDMANKVSYVNKFKKDPYKYKFETLLNYMNINYEYSEEYIKTKPLDNDYYYPKYVETYVPYSNDYSLRYYSQPHNVLNLNIFGVYFIYDTNNKLVYIGKSNSNVIKKSLESANERLNGVFSKIEYKLPKTHSDTNIYELYYISKYKPKYNIESKFNDKLSIILPRIRTTLCIKYKFSENNKLKNISYIKKKVPYKEYWENKEQYNIYENNAKVNTDNININNDKSDYLKSMSLDKSFIVGITNKKTNSWYYI